ncbi:methyltransferase domain-containing protein [Microbacterium sp. JZ70]
MHDFDKAFWEDHWSAHAPSDPGLDAPHPYLDREIGGLAPGTALDAGCGTGAEAVWLAERGWQVTGVDLSANALAAAARRAAAAGVADRIDWVEADIARWRPRRTWSLVLTSYAHADIGQLDLFRLLASQVAPGGTLLVVAHAPSPAHGHGTVPHPAHATASPGDIASLLTAPEWQVDSRYTSSRALTIGTHRQHLRDVVVRAHRVH